MKRFTSLDFAPLKEQSKNKTRQTKTTTKLKFYNKPHLFQSLRLLYGHVETQLSQLNCRRFVRRQARPSGCCPSQSSLELTHNIHYIIRQTAKLYGWCEDGRLWHLYRSHLSLLAGYLRNTEIV